MKLDELRMRLKNRTARLAVTGQGYMGLPVAAMFAEVAGSDVFEHIKGCDAAAAAATL